jgi:hypothetical protein
MVVYGDLVNRLRRAPDGFPAAEATKELQDFGNRAAKEAAEHGIVVFEPMPTTSTNTVNTVARAPAGRGGEPSEFSNAGGFRLCHPEQGRAGDPH